MKTSMMDLQTSTLTLSFWNMSRNGRKRSWDRATTDGTVKTTKVTDYLTSPEGKGSLARRCSLTIEKRTEKLWK